MPAFASASLRLGAELRQSTTLSPRLQHAVRLLQMSSLDFSALVRDQLDSNPFLEADEDMAPEPIGDEREPWPGAATPSLRRAEADELAALEALPAQTPLNTHLHRQLSVLPLSERDLVLARAVVESLDDDGYLRTPLEELRGLPGIAPPPAADELRIALARVQSLEPAGVAARSVGECLLLQLPSIDGDETRALARRIVVGELQALAARDVEGIARRLGETAQRVAAACERIRRLDPRPGWRYGAAPTEYIVPDVVARKRRGQWTVQLNPAVVPRVRLNRVYAELFQRHRGGGDGALAGHLQEARWTLRNVEQRFATILDVAREIVQRQRRFLDFGAMAMKPLALREIAEAVGVHESTVSRVTRNKYLATPSGVFELKHFFSRPLVSTNGNACSGTAVRELVKEIIEAEHAEAPLSDAEIARQLARQGLAIARRTVTKYRQQLRIDAVERRRRT